MRSLLRSSSKPTVTKNPFALEAAVRAICLGIELLLGRVTKLVPFAIFVCLLGLTQGDELRAQWSTSPTVNNAVSTPAGDQRYPQTVSDGAGGTIIVWEDSRSGTADIYAQRLNASGVAQWTANGVVICNAANIQGGPRIISDGAGGAIITWYDLRNGGGNYDIYAQRVNSSGTVQWTANGVVISSAANSQTSPRIAGDGSGGAIIAWTDLRNGTDNDIFAQRINSSGVTQWTANGDTVCVAPFAQAIGGIVSDGASGAIIAWEDMRNGVDNRIYGQRINGAGVSQWTSNGIALGTGTGNQDTPGIEADGSGGAFIAWRDLRNADYDLYAQRVNSAGSLLWGASAIAVAVAPGFQQVPSIVRDGSGGAFIAWFDTRDDVNGDVYAQRLNSGGSALWTPNGVPVVNTPDQQQDPLAVSDSAGGIFVTWWDGRGGNADIYAQRLNGSGATLWTTGGKAVCTAPDFQFWHALMNDGSGNMISVWSDRRSGSDYDIYTQLLLPDGDLGSNNSQVGIVSTFPAHNSLNIAPTSNLTVNFPQEMRSDSLNSRTVKVWGSQSGLHTAAYNYNGAVLTIDPDSDFVAGEIVSVTLTNGILAVNLDSLIKYVWQFHVGTGAAYATFTRLDTVNVGTNPSYMASADFNGDGYVDIVTSNQSSNNVSVALNDGTGHFGGPTNYAVGNLPYVVQPADYDGDGDIDLAVATNTGSVISMLLNNGAGGFSAGTDFNAGVAQLTLTAADFDGDGDIDLISSESGTSLRVRLNNGFGVFSSGNTISTQTNPYFIASADADNDGDIDLIAVNYGSGTFTVAFNDGSGNFGGATNYSTNGVQPRTIRCADFDGDGDVDLALVNENSGNVAIRLNDGSGVFSGNEIAVGSLPEALALGDMDGDGDIDVMVTNYGSTTIQRVTNNGAGTFAAGPTFGLTNGGWTIGTADYDGDGRMDVAVTDNTTNQVYILQNNPILPTTTTVTNTNDTGVGSLRDAISYANSHAGPDTILFAGGLAGDSISLVSGLTLTDDSTFINADINNDSIPDIVIMPFNSGLSAFTINATAAYTTIQGFKIVRLVQTFSNGINVLGPNATVRYNYFGTEGTNSRGLSQNLEFSGSAINAYVYRNVFANAAGAGLRTQVFVGIDSTKVIENFIGTNASGTSALPNDRGIWIAGQITDIGWTIKDNVISGNTFNGIELRSAFGAPSNGFKIQGNKIGVAADGVTQLANGADGVYVGDNTSPARYNLVGGTTAAERNIISGNSGNGVNVGSDSNTVSGNYIGVNATGNVALPNGSMGVQLQNASANTIGNGNIISGNTANGIWIYANGGYSDDNYIQNNTIGVGADGTTAVPNNQHGVRIYSFSGWGAQRNIFLDNVIAYNNFYAFEMDGDASADSMIAHGNVIYRNSLGGMNFVSGSNGNVAPPKLDFMGADSVVHGTSAPNAFIQIYVDSTSQGRIRIGTGNADAGGNFSVPVTLLGTEPPFLTALQDSAGRTSGFSIPDTLAFSDPLLVTSTDGNSAVFGTIRYAINYANSNVGPDTIRFDPSLAGQTINAFSQLPNLTDDGTFIDGDINGNGYADDITIDGGGSASICFLIQSNYNTIKHLYITGYQTAASAIDIDGGRENRIVGNILYSNNQGVHLMNGARANKIGDGTIAGRNYIAASNDGGGGNVPGIFIGGAGTDSNIVVGNFIGTVDGEIADGNGVGIAIGSGAKYNRIGDASSPIYNVISGNLYAGISLFQADSNLIVRNIIGADSTGTQPLGNNSYGIELIKSSGNWVGDGTPAGRNIIADNSSGNLSGAGIFLDSAYSNKILGNFIGTDITGIVALTNRSGGGDGSGIIVDNGSNYNDIGDGTVGGRNVLGANGAGGDFQNAIVIWNLSDYNTVAGNFIGTDSTGLAVLGSSGRGIYVSDGFGNRIGAYGAPQIIGGIGGNAIEVYASDSTVVINNYIGLGADGTTALANTGNGVDLQGGSLTNLIGDGTVGGRNIIANNSNGVSIDATSLYNTVAGNFVGTDTSGTVASPNSTGIYNQAKHTAIGDGTVGGRNIISGNTIGINFDTVDSSQIIGNYVGVDPSGTLTVGNTTGIMVLGNDNAVGGPFTGQGNLVSGNGGDGIRIVGPGSLRNFVTGNIVGLDFDGANSVPNTVGVRILNGAMYTFVGTPFGAHNVISGNASHGIVISSSDSNGVFRSYIGTDTSGSISRPNGGDGVYMDGGTGNAIGDINLGNIISGNTGNGVSLLASASSSVGNYVAYNRIGVAADSVSALGNANDGVYIAGISTFVSGNQILYNRIAYNGLTGIVADGTLFQVDSDNFFANEIYSNSSAGILLVGGAHQNVGTPNITNVGMDSTVAGRAAPNALVQIFADSVSQGRIFLDSVYADAGGNWSRKLNPFPGMNYTAIQDSLGHSSAFSAPIPAMPIDPHLVTSLLDDGSPGTLRYAVSFANSNAGPDTIRFDMSIKDSTIVLGSALSLTADSTVINGDVDTDNKPSIIIDGAGGNYAGFDVQSAHNELRNLNMVNFNSVSLGAIRVRNATATNNIIAGNYLGTTLDGDTVNATGNYRGIIVQLGASNNTIGGLAPIDANVISGQTADGIELNAANNNRIIGNYIGTNFDGSKGVGLGNVSGIVIGNGADSNMVGDTLVSGRNIISGNTGRGILIQGAATSDNQILNNYIGLDITGTVSFGNNGQNIRIGGGTGNRIGNGQPNGRNIIGGSTTGIEIQGSSSSSTYIIGNYIGTDFTGTAAAPNNDGVYILSNAVGNLVGDGTLGGRNVISGNTNNGVRLAASSNVVTGNLIGTTPDGMSSLANNFGVDIASAADDNIIDKNVISGNATIGIRTYGRHTTIRKNLIGVAVDTVTALPNAGGTGIAVDISGSDSITANVVAYNGGAGITVNSTSSPDSVVMFKNSIYSNAGIGIFNVAGSQQGVAPPRLQYILPDSTIYGQSAPFAVVQIYADSANEGKIFLDSTIANGAGNWSKRVPLLSGFNATALQDSAGNTSQFSLPIAMAPIDPLVVTSTADDSSAGTLRYAIGYANSLPGRNLITFSLPANDTIRITRVLPNISDTLDIDGQATNVTLGAEPGFADFAMMNLRAPLSRLQNFNFYGRGLAQRGIFIDNAAPGGNDSKLDNVDFLEFTQLGVQGDAVRDTIINSHVAGNTLAGIVPGSLWVIEGNMIGTNAIGTAAYGVAQANGVYVNVYGGVTIRQNAISGHSAVGGAGVRIVESSNNTIVYNGIGTDFSASAAIPNETGILIDSLSKYNTIGLPGQFNVISGNTAAGIQIQNTGADSNYIRSNFIGTDVAGTAALGNATGVSTSLTTGPNFIGDGTPAGRNIISGNTSHGLYLFGPDVATGNFIGVDATGLAALGNAAFGIYVYGSGTRIDRNLISGNTLEGIYIAGLDSHIVAGNLIGTDSTGNAALPNAGGITLTNIAFGTRIGGATVSDRNVISGNTNAGLRIENGARNIAVLGNFIGLSADGQSDLGNTGNGVEVVNSSGNIIGGAIAGARNYITGNDNWGVYLANTADSNAVMGNYIGTDSTGSTGVGYQITGVNVNGPYNQIGGYQPGQGNVIAGGIGYTVALGSAKDNLVAGNFMGISPTGTPITGTLSGFYITGNSRRDSLVGNTMAYMSSSPLIIQDAPADSITFFGNKVHHNAGDFNINAGAQLSVAPPRILSIGADSTVLGNSAPFALIQIFADSTNDGEFFVDTTIANGTGLWSKKIPLLAGTNITAMQDSAGNTSNFSAPLAPQPQIVIAGSPVLYGNVGVGLNKIDTVTVYNKGAGNLSISGVSILNGSPEFTVVDTVPNNLVIAPNDSVLFVLQYQPSTFTLSQDSLQILSNDPGAPNFKVPISGNGVAGNLSAIPASFNYGTVPTGDSATTQIKLYSTAGAVNTIGTNMVFGSSFRIDSTAGPSTLFAGDTLRVFVKYVATGFSPETDTVLVSNNSSVSPVKIAFNGTPQSGNIAAFPSSVNYGNVVNTDSGFAIVKIARVSGGQTRVDSIKWKSGVDFYGSYNPPLPFQLRNGDTIVISSAYHASLFGVQVDTILVYSNAQAGGLIKIPLTGNGVAGTLATLQPLVNFGTVQVGDSAVQTLKVYPATGAVAVNSASIQAGTDFFITPLSALPLTLYPGDTLMVRAKFMPTIFGSRVDTADLNNNSVVNPFRISFSGTGAVGSLSSNPGSVGFGNVPLGQGSGQIVKLYTTVGAVRVSSLSIAGVGDFTISGSPTLPDTLFPGDTLTVGLNFVPTAFASITDTLLVGNNTGTTFRVPLSGTGIAGTLLSSVAPLSYGNVPLGNNSTQTVKLYSSGGAVRVSGINMGVGGDYTITNGITLPDTLFLGDTIAVNVRFSPSVFAGVIDTLVVTNNSLAPVFKIGASGTGIPGTLSALVSPINYGNIPVGNNATQQVKVYSNGGAVRISAASILTGADFSITNSPQIPDTLFGGDTLLLSVRFAPTSFAALVDSVVIGNNSGTPSFRIGLNGVGIPGTLGVSSNPLAYGTLPVGNNTTQTLKFYSNGGAVIVSSSLLDGSGHFTVLNPPSLPDTLFANDTISLNIRFAPQAFGAVNDTLRLINNSVAGVIKVPVTGTGLSGSLAALTAPIAYGNVPVGSSLIRTAKIYSTGGAVEVTSAAITGGVYFSITGSSTLPDTLFAGDTLSVSIQFAPNAFGALADTLSVVNNSGVPAFRLALSGQGTAGTVSALATPINYGNVGMGTSMTRTVRVFTTGGAVQLTAASLAQAGDYAITSALVFPDTLYSSDTLSIDIQFTPSVFAGVSDTLRLQNNSAQTLFTVPLQGTGIAGNLASVIPSFGNVAAQTSTTRTIKVYPTGGAVKVNSVSLLAGTEFSLTGLPLLPDTLFVGDTLLVDIQAAPSTFGTRTDTLVVTNNSGVSSLSLALSVQGVAGVLLSDVSSVNVGNVGVQKSTTTMVKFYSNGGAVQVSGSTLFAGSSFVIDSTQGQGFLGAGDTMRVYLRFSPLAFGAANDTIYISNNSVVNPVKIPLLGTGIPGSLAVFSDPYDFSNVLVGDSLTRDIRIFAVGGAVLTSGVTVQGGAAYSIVSVTNGGSMIVGDADTLFATIKFNPIVFGPNNDVIQVANNSLTPTFSFGVTGSGSIGNLNASVSSLSFGSVQIGDSLGLKVRMTPTSDGIDVTSSSFGSGTHYRVSTSQALPATLNIGDTLVATVYFRPQTFGSLSDTIRFVNISLNNPIVVVLNGTGAVGTLSPFAAQKNFGLVTLADSSTRNVRLYTSAGAVTINSFTLDNGVEFQPTTAVTLPYTINPGDTLKIPVKFKPTLFGVVSDTMRVTNNSANPVFKVVLNGVGNSGTLVAVPPSVNFNQVLLGDSLTRTVKLYATGTNVLVSSSSLSAAGIYSFTSGTSLPTTLVAGVDTLVLTVKFKPTAFATYSERITLNNNSLVNPLKINLDGVGAAGALAVTPTSQNFGSVLVGDSSLQVVKIFPTSGSLIINSLAMDYGSGFTQSGGSLPDTLRAGDTLAVTIKFKPSAFAVQSDTLRIGSNSTLVKVPFDGTGQAGTLASNAATFDFGTVRVNDTKTRTLRLFTSSGRVRINSIALGSGVQYKLSGVPTLPITLKPSDTINVIVSFKPLTGASLPDTIYIANNSAVPSQTIVLQGVGENNLPPNVFALKDPLNGLLIGSRTPTLSWEGRGDPNGDTLSYIVQISKFANFSTIGRQYTTADTSVTVLTNLDSLGVYYWRVSANDNAGGITLATGSGSFRIDAVSPKLYLAILASTIQNNYVEVYVNTSEPLTSLTGIFDLKDSLGVLLSSDTSVIATSVNGSVFYQSYKLSRSGSLTVSVSATDSTGNTTAINQTYSIAQISRSSAFALKSPDGSMVIRGAKHSVQGEGFLMVSRINDQGEVPVNLSKAIGMEATKTADQWSQVGDAIRIVSTARLSKALGLTLQINDESLDRLRIQYADFDERRLGLYRQDGSNWVYEGGESSQGSLTAKIEAYGTFAVYYDPTHEFLPESLELAQNYPNPFNPTTTIKFALPDAGRVRLVVYNILGQKVRELVDGFKDAGRYEVLWNGRNDKGQLVSSGLYIYRLESVKGIQSRKMLLVK